MKTPTTTAAKQVIAEVSGGPRKDYLYDQFVMSTFKPTNDIVDEMTAHKAGVLHSAVIVAKEAGELLDAVARLCFYNKELDLENVEEELGDIEYGLATLRVQLGLSRTSSLNGNVMKLDERYSRGRFSNEQANARADKEPNG